MARPWSYLNFDALTEVDTDLYELEASKNCDLMLGGSSERRAAVKLVKAISELHDVCRVQIVGPKSIRIWLKGERKDDHVVNMIWRCAE